MVVDGVVDVAAALIDVGVAAIAFVVVCCCCCFALSKWAK
jgi:hypothetical protein